MQACTAAATAIETALKALGSDARIDPRTLHSHDIARIVEELPPADAAAALQTPRPPRLLHAMKHSADSALTSHGLETGPSP